MSFLNIFRRRSLRNRVKEKYISGCLLLYLGPFSQGRQEQLKKVIRQRLADEFGITRTVHRRKAGRVA